MARRRGHWQSFKDFIGLWADLFKQHNLLTYASAIAFQALVAFVALMLLSIGILGALGRPDVWTKQLAPAIEPKVLFPVFAGMNATVERIFHSSSAGLIAFAAVLAVWEVSGVVRACMGALERVYEQEETRPWWIRFPVSIAIALGITIAIVGALLLATAARTAVHGTWSVPFAIGRWLLAIVLIGGAFGLLVRYAPAESRTKRWVSGGTTLVVVAWVVQSLLFAVYLRSLADYRTTTGSLLGVYFLTTFLYVAAIILLVAMELDELVRRDLSGADERGILEIVRDVF